MALCLLIQISTSFHYSLFWYIMHNLYFNCFVFHVVHFRCGWSRHCKAPWSKYQCYSGASDVDVTKLESLPTSGLSDAQVKEAEELRQRILKEEKENPLEKLTGMPNPPPLNLPAIPPPPTPPPALNRKSWFWGTQKYVYLFCFVLFWASRSDRGWSSCVLGLMFFSISLLDFWLINPTKYDVRDHSELIDWMIFVSTQSCVFCFVLFCFVLFRLNGYHGVKQR